MTGFSKLPLKLLSNHTNPIHLADLGILRQSNKGGGRLPRDSELLEFNVFNRLLSLKLMGLIGPKAI